MKTVRLKIYSFRELSKEAKKKALEDYSYGTEYYWWDDALKSLQEVAVHFNANISKYEIDFGSLSVNYTSSSWVKFQVDGDENIPDQELTDIIESMGSYDKETLKGLGDCKFTGYCMDEDVADGIRLAYFNGVTNIYSLLKAGAESWLKAIAADYSYQLSEEGFADHADANGYEFTQDGKRFYSPKKLKS